MYTRINQAADNGGPHHRLPSLSPYNTRLPLNEPYTLVPLSIPKTDASLQAVEDSLNGITITPFRNTSRTTLNQLESTLNGWSTHAPWLDGPKWYEFLRQFAEHYFQASEQTPLALHVRASLTAFPLAFWHTDINVFERRSRRRAVMYLLGPSMQFIPRMTENDFKEFYNYYQTRKSLLSTSVGLSRSRTSSLPPDLNDVARLNAHDESPQFVSRDSPPEILPTRMALIHNLVTVEAFRSRLPIGLVHREHRVVQNHIKLRVMLDID